MAENLKSEPKMYYAHTNYMPSDVISAAVESIESQGWEVVCTVFHGAMTIEQMEGKKSTAILTGLPSVPLMAHSIIVKKMGTKEKPPEMVGANISASIPTAIKRG